MKKILAIFLAVAMILSICAVSSFAAGENIALDKDVAVYDESTVVGVNPNMTMGFWGVEYLVDGKWPAFLTAADTELGWYASCVDPNVDLTVEIDLGEVYSIGEVKVLPMKFVGGYTFPSTYEVLLSTDGTNYTSIGGETDAHVGEFIFSNYNVENAYSLEGYTGETIPVFNGEGTQARYVAIHVTKLGNDPGDGVRYAGIGEIEVYEYEAPHTPTMRSFDASLGDSLSYDQILVNGSEIANGNSAVIANKKGIDGTDGSITEVALHGWYGNTGSATEAFGYKINDEAIVYGDFFAATEDAVIGVGGQYAKRFTIPVDVSGLTGAGNVIWIYAKLANGDEVKLDRFDNRGTDNEKDREIYVIYNGPESGSETPAYVYRNASFDSFYVDGVLNFGEADGNASDKLDARSRRVGEGDGAIQELMLRGWIGFDQEIEAFGYKIGNADPVYSQDFFQATEDAVKGAGGEFAQRYCVTVPVAGIEGEQTIVMMVKLANGTEVAIDDQLEATGVATPPNTSFTFVGVPGQQPPAPTADASMIIFVVAAAAIALVVLKKKAF